jgi:hypothetical protein
MNFSNIAQLNFESAISWLANILEIFNALVLVWLSLVERWKHKKALKEGEYLSEVGVSINTLRQVSGRLILHSRSAPERSLLTLVGGNKVAVETILAGITMMEKTNSDNAILRFANPQEASRIMQRAVGDVSGLTGEKFALQAASGRFREAEFVLALTCERRIRPEDPKRRIRVQLLRVVDLEKISGDTSCILWEAEEVSGHYERRTRTLHQVSELWEGWKAGDPEARSYGIAKIKLAY